MSLWQVSPVHFDTVLVCAVGTSYLDFDMTVFLHLACWHLNSAKMMTLEILLFSGGMLWMAFPCIPPGFLLSKQPQQRISWSSICEPWLVFKRWHWLNIFFSSHSSSVECNATIFIIIASLWRCLLYKRILQLFLECSHFYHLQMIGSLRGDLTCISLVNPFI